MPHVLVAGATGYLGRYVVSEYAARGWTVTALVRDASRASDLEADHVRQVQVTDAKSLVGVMQGIDLVVSALGITRQAEGVGYWDVDYQANLNLLNEALSANVPRFAYIHVLGADHMPDVPLVQAKTAFVTELQSAPIVSTIIAPSGYFSDMSDFLQMAKSGRVWLFGEGAHRLNPIHGADLAAATAEAIDAEQGWLDVGGPEIFTHEDLAKLAFSALGTPVKISRIPDWVRRAVLRLLPFTTRRRTRGPLQFFLSAMGQDMVGERRGERTLGRHFRQELKRL